MEFAMTRINDWFSSDYLGINTSKTQAMVLGRNSGYEYDLHVGPDHIKVETTLKILGVTLDSSLTYKEHITTVLKKVYAKVAALRRIKRVVPIQTMVALYKTYVLPHLEYCCPLLLGATKTQKDRLEKSNYYSLRTLLNLGRSSSYENCLVISNMRKLEHRRQVQALLLFFKSYRMQQATYIANFFVQFALFCS
ncbi:predicted protein [Nematostella vectensis]|uniref:RNA-directed DNA polymerase n=1 Tax=Nematostella vectensis TaxID=45351 RepID=A7SR43_NEMVE|nr:predicted protein [Nematostella vectensis]|eukprot:XP_001625930.1 predicted protein [Nematostella vectensis]